MINKILIAIAFAFYIASLFLPAVVFKPTIQDNKKNYTCSFIDFHKELDSRYCRNENNNYYSCHDKSQPATKFFPAAKQVSRDELNAWCGDDWNLPASYFLHGYAILLNPAALFFISWWANFLFLLSSIFILGKKNLWAVVSSVLSLIVALSAIFIFDSMPRNEGGANDFIVDHFASGYYIWLISMGVLILCSTLALLAKEETPNTNNNITDNNI